METEFWGVEVKRGEPLKVSPGYRMILHLSQASLGEHKNEKGKESVSLFVNVDGKKLVLGTLITNKLPQHQFDLLFDREFELSHDWKGGSIYFYGYKASNSLGEEHFSDPTESPEGESDESLFDSEDEEYIPLNLTDNGKPRSNVEQVKPELKAKQERSESKAEQEKSEAQNEQEKHEAKAELEKPELEAEKQKAEPNAEQKKTNSKGKKKKRKRKPNVEQEKPELNVEQQKPEPNAEQERTDSKDKWKSRKPEPNVEQEGPELKFEQQKPEPYAEQERTNLIVKRKEKKPKKPKKDKLAEAETCNVPNNESDAGKDSKKIAETSKDVNPEEHDESTYEDLISDDDEEDKSEVVSRKKRPKKKKAKLLPQHEAGGDKAAPLPGNEAAQTSTDQANKPTPVPGITYTCKSCNKAFGSEKAVEDHTKIKHGDGK